MNAHKTPALAALAIATMLLAGTAAYAASPCMVGANGDNHDCKATCTEDYQAAKDACLDRDHACVEVCRAQRSDCHDATGIDQAIASCNATLDDARQSCRDAHPAGSPERDACVDQAQVVAFQCRDAAREAAKPGLKACRAAFRSCARSCAPNVPPDPAGNKQCKADAHTAFVSCQASCREDFQVAKDACKNRDHACAEDCRASRADCERPILDQRDAAIADCNATRDGAIDNCRTLYGEGTPERAQCIDNAQVAAFECRDQKNEDAHPGLSACRQQFNQCVEACPPPSPPS